MDWLDDPWMLLNFLGGIGLFLLGMRLMTDGLRVAAGDALRRILEASTQSRWRALATGILMTGLVQSSSAVIFATIGFVNAGMLGLVQAVGVIYGANVGTTVTSWLVSQIGLEFSVRAMALPVIAVGMILRVLGGNRPRGALGDAITGFGVFFLGLDVLTGLFRADAGLLPVDTEAVGFFRLLMFFLGGVAMTVVMQSSSAAVATSSKMTAETLF
jgi:phosphate:Na+ symporter